jgi:plasmid stabilization system protein ParE
MAKPLRFHPLVASDVLAACGWYEARSPGLGERFQLAVDARFDAIVTSPEIFPHAISTVGHRFVRIPRFPYLVLFRERSHSLDVIGLFHSASNPAMWRRRARDW